MKAILLFIALVVLGPAALATDTQGYWTGVAIRGGEKRPILLRIGVNDGRLTASYSLPALGVEGIPLNEFNVDEANGALTAGRTFQGKLAGDRISGELWPTLLHGPPVVVELQRESTAPVIATRERAVEFDSRGYKLRGWLISPQARGRYPALVSLHGSGPSTRWLALARARRFAEAGYAMLIFDKPGNGESEGDWTMTSLDEMAQDAVAAVDFLRAQPEVIPQKVGLWGHSQAGWVISRAGATSNHVAFAIVLAGGGATSREVEDYGYLGRLKHANANPEATRKAMVWVSDYYDYLRSGNGYAKLTALLKSNAGEDWAKALAIDTVYPTPEQQPKWKWVATYDPQSDIRHIRFPVLLLFADRDESSPSERSLAGWRDALAAGGNRRVEWKVFLNADHHFLTPAHTDRWPSLAPGFYETQIGWLKRVVGR